MKKIYLLTFMLASFNFVNAQNPILNPSLEDWSLGDPVDWVTNNAKGVSITQVSPGNSGDYAAQVRPWVGDTVPPQLSSIISVTQNYASVDFYYKSNFVSGDAVFVAAIVYDDAYTIIGIALDSIKTNASGFTHYNIPIQMGGGSAALVLLTFKLANSDNAVQPQSDSYFIIDDVALLSDGTVGVQKLNVTNHLQVYPVPARDWLTVKGQTINNKPMQYKIADVTGRVVMERQSQTPCNNFINEELSLQGIAPGFYSLMMIADEKSITRRIVIE